MRLLRPSRCFPSPNGLSLFLFAHLWPVGIPLSRQDTVPSVKGLSFSSPTLPCFSPWITYSLVPFPGSSFSVHFPTSSCIPSFQWPLFPPHSSVWCRSHLPPLQTWGKECLTHISPFDRSWFLWPFSMRIMSFCCVSSLYSTITTPWQCLPLAPLKVFLMGLWVPHWALDDNYSPRQYFWPKVISFPRWWNLLQGTKLSALPSI